MRRGRLLLVCLLIGSAALNIYLLLGRSAGRSPAIAAGGASSVREAQPLRAVTVDRRPAVAPLDSCQRQLVTTRGELETAKENLAQRIEPKQRFNDGEREPGMEARFAPLVDAAFAKLPKQVGHTIECRGDVCQVRVSAATRQDARQAWKTLTTDSAVGSASDGFMSESGVPVIDQVSGKGGFDVDLYLFTRSAADATSLLEALVDRFRGSSAVRDCASVGADLGVLEAHLSVTSANAALAMAFGGSLGGTAVGRCIADKLVASATELRLPPGSRYGSAYASFTSPHGE